MNGRANNSGVTIADLRILAHDGDPQAARWGQPSWGVEEPSGYHRCSYCGSIPIYEAIDVLGTTGARFSGSDWKYGWPHKFYLDAPNTAGGLFCVGSFHGPDTAALPADYVPVDQLTDEQRAIAIRDGALSADPTRRADDRPPLGFKFSERTHFHLNFYNAHIEDIAADPRAVLAYSKSTHRTLGIAFQLVDGRVKWAAVPGLQRWGHIEADALPVIEGSGG